MPKVRVVLEVDVCAKTGAVVCVEEVCEEKPAEEAAPAGEVPCAETPAAEATAEPGGTQESATATEGGEGTCKAAESAAPAEGGGAPTA